MSVLPHGVLLPESVLTSPAFILFATFVAFNTVIYLGLTIAKFFPWPPQQAPTRARALLPTVLLAATPSPKDSSMSPTILPTATSTGDPFIEARRALAQRTIPVALMLTGALVILVTLAGLVVSSEATLTQYVVSFAFGVAVVALGQVTSRRPPPGQWLSWVWVFVATAIVAEVTWDAWQDDLALGMVYAIVALSFVLPVAMAWAPALTGGAISLAMVAAGGVAIDQIASLPWSIAACMAVAIGAILLYLRMSGLDALTLEQMRTNTLVSTDPLTGVLSRDGMRQVAPSVLAVAHQAKLDVHVVEVDIERLGQMNRDYGMEYGDAALVAVTRAVQLLSTEGDVVARWSGDVILALGVGPAPNAHAWESAIDTTVAASGLSLGKADIRVRVGVAQGPATPDALRLLPGEASVQRRASGGTQT